MENKTVSILSTRPLDADTLQNLPDNFQIDIVSFIETKNIVDAFIEQEIITTAEQKQTIVFTSMNAAEAVVAILQKNKLQPDWNNMRKNVPAIKAVKQKLSDMNQCSLFQSIYTAGNFNNTELIQKVVNNMAAKMRTQHQPGCYYIEAINDFIAVTAN